MELTVDKVFDQLPYDQLGKVQRLHLMGGAFALGALLFIVIYFAFFNYMEEKQEELNKNKSTAEIKLKNYQNLLSRKDAINMELVSAQGELTQVKGQMPQRGDIIDFVRRLSYVANKLELEIMLVNRMPEEARDYYKVVPIEILVRGGFYKTAALMEAIQNLLRVVNITEMHMYAKEVKSDTPVPPILETYSLALAYSYVEGAESKPPPKKESKDGKDGKDSKDAKDKKEVKKEH